MLTNPLTQRRAGVLLHPTSLPGKGSQGDLGPDARRFVDFLQSAGMTVWQMLPLGPTHADHSPYQCLSVHAGSRSLVSLADLADKGWLDAASLDEVSFDANLKQAHTGFDSVATPADKSAYAAFKVTHTCWLEDYACYQAIRTVHDALPWFRWPVELRDREPVAMQRFRAEHAALIEQICFEQYLFFMQWRALRDYAHQHDVALFGDMPIYVAHDSADVWANRDLFTIDAAGELEVVAGVPPDYFSETGQRWGNPLYHWDKIRELDFRWWQKRFKTQLDMFDIIRLDHFRGFEKYWEIPAAAETAVDGRWVAGPGKALFERLQQDFGELPLVAEDLGIITPEVDALRTGLGFPGMKILQFAFDGGEDNPYLPENHEPLSVVYTGTHDNDTTLGWYESLDSAAREKVDTYLSAEPSEMPLALIKIALASQSRLAIIPMQDLLGLGSDARMNTPGTAEGNWAWRFSWGQLSADLALQGHVLVKQANRLANSPI